VFACFNGGVSSTAWCGEAHAVALRICCRACICGGDAHGKWRSARQREIACAYARGSHGCLNPGMVGCVHLDCFNLRRVGPGLASGEIRRWWHAAVGGTKRGRAGLHLGSKGGLVGLDPGRGPRRGGIPLTSRRPPQVCCGSVLSRVGKGLLRRACRAAATVAAMPKHAAVVKPVGRCFRVGKPRGESGKRQLAEQVCKTWRRVDGGRALSNTPAWQYGGMNYTCSKPPAHLNGSVSGAASLLCALLQVELRLGVPLFAW